ncbi:MAG: AAC(3) family N-acetyltransferase [Spirochaetes bacterium]|nr:AAC(3) family N-acetyltransferase [Spirochaetota bacterium]
MIKGDLLLLHSNVRRTFIKYKKARSNITIEDILASFLMAVGDAGTLLLPLFNFGFSSGEPFDINNTPSKMGALTEAGRKHIDAIRTGHPIYSFAAIGEKKELFLNIDNYSGYGADSPFAILHKNNGKIAVLDLPDQNSMTFYHYVEEMENVPYRFHKKFTGFYTDKNGVTENKEYSLFVRDVEKGVETYVYPMEDYLWNEGLYSGFKENTESGLRIIKSTDIYNATSHIINTGKFENMLMRYSKKRS